MRSETIQLRSAEKPFEAYVSYPAAIKGPAIIVVHEIYGLNDQVRGVADRLAAEGYLALAPELMPPDLKSLVGTELVAQLADPATRDEAQKKVRAALAPMRTPEFAKIAVAKLEVCFAFLKAQPESNGAVGILGFCFGGTYAFALAVHQPELKFSIPFYGQPPEPLDSVESITCPVLAFYGDQDERLMATLPDLEKAMDAHGKNFSGLVYPGVGHAFFNEKNPRMYNAEAAAKAWEEVKKFLTRLSVSSGKA